MWISWSRICWKCSKSGCQFSCGWYFIEKASIAKPLDSEFNDYEKQEVLIWSNTFARQIISCTDNNVDLAKVNVIDPAKDNLTQPLSVKEILDELESKDDYDKALPIPKDKDLELTTF